MKGIKEAFIDAGEISQMLGIGMTKAYAIIKEYNAELEAKGYFTMRGKCPRKYFEQKIYGYEDYYNPDYEPQRNRSKVAEEMDYEAAVGDSVISEQDEVDIQPETKVLPGDDAEIAENVMSKCSMDDKIQLWAKALPNLTEETCKKHFDELGFPELKGIFTKRNNYTKTYEDNSFIRDILYVLKKNTWIFDYYKKSDDEGYVVVKNPIKDKRY